MPPLAIIGQEAMPEHRFAKDHPVAKLLRRQLFRILMLQGFGIPAVIRMALDAEPVMHPAHVQFLAGRHVKQRQVQGGSAGMPGFFGDVSPHEQEGFVDIRIEVRPHQGIREVLPPTDEMIHGTLRPVGVVNLQPVALLFDVIADRFQAVRRLTRQERRRLQIAINPLSYKVIGSEVPGFQDGIRHHIRDVHKIAGIRLWRRFLPAAGCCQKQGPDKDSQQTGSLSHCQFLLHRNKYTNFPSKLLGKETRNLYKNHKKDVYPEQLLLLSNRQSP